MKIRTRLTLLFFSMVILVISVLSISIYYFSANYREQDFHRRLKNRAVNIAKVLTTVKEVDADLLKRMEQNNPASLTNQFIIIYNQNDQELYRSEGKCPILLEPDFIEQVRVKKDIWYRDHEFEVNGFVQREKDSELIVVAMAADIYGNDALYNLRSILFIVFIISIVLFSFLGWIYAGRALQPISGIVNEVNAITEFNLNLRLDEGNHKDELSKLAQAFNILLKRLNGVLLSQKHFIANASHEIKTPITVMTGEIEVALLQDRSQDYYQTILRSVLFGLKKLNSLSSQLLMLAQTSSETPDRKFTLIRIDDIFWEVKTELQKIHPEYEINILFDLDVNHDMLLIEGDEHLLKVAVQNLTENACKYSHNHMVTIHLNANAHGYITATFKNLGTISAENLDKIFDPFFRGKNTKDSEGFGIGLSLVYWITKLHQGQISAENENEYIKFTLKIPVSISRH